MSMPVHKWRWLAKEWVWESGTADIFRGFMVSLYVKGKENDHVQAYAPTGAMVLKRWGGLTSKLDGYPVTSDPHLWWQAGPWFSITIYCCPIKMSGSQFWVSSRKKAGKARWLSPWVCNFVLQTKKYKLMGKGTTKKIHRREQYCRILLLSLPCQVELSFFCFSTIKLVKILHLTKLWGTYCSSETYKIY